MIRSVTIPLAGSRMGQTTSSIAYVASTCTQRHPVTGLCIADVFLPDDSNPDYGGGGFPGDPGEAQALQDWARGEASDISEAGLRQLVLAQSLNAGNIPSPLPGLGLTIPNPVKNWLLIGGAVVLGIAVLNGGGRR